MCQSLRYSVPHESYHTVSLMHLNPEADSVLIKVRNLVVDLRFFGIDLDFEMSKGKCRSRFQQAHLENLCSVLIQIG